MWNAQSKKLCDKAIFRCKGDFKTIWKEQGTVRWWGMNATNLEYDLQIQ
jgi:hypothetical protein